MIRWFYETRQMDRWTPHLSADKPDLHDDMHIKRVGGIGPKVRAHPVQIRETDTGLTLDALQAIYGVQE